MMIKKGQMLKFSRPMSTMRTVLECVENGISHRADIVTKTKLTPGQVKSALHNLAFIGAILSSTDEQDRRVYILPGQITTIAKCLCGVNSIFNVR